MTQGEADEEGRVSFVFVPERTQTIMLGKTQLPEVQCRGGRNTRLLAHICEDQGAELEIK